MHLLDGPEALNFGVEKARVPGVPQSPVGFRNGGVTFSIALRFSRWAHSSLSPTGGVKSCICFVPVNRGLKGSGRAKFPFILASFVFGSLVGFYGPLRSLPVWCSFPETGYLTCGAGGRWSTAPLFVFLSTLALVQAHYFLYRVACCCQSVPPFLYGPVE